MKRTIYFWGFLLSLVILGVPRADALVGTVYNGAMNNADVNRDGTINALDLSKLIEYNMGDYSAISNN